MQDLRYVASDLLPTLRTLLQTETDPLLTEVYRRYIAPDQTCNHNILELGISYKGQVERALVKDRRQDMAQVLAKQRCSTNNILINGDLICVLRGKWMNKLLYLST